MKTPKITASFTITLEQLEILDNIAVEYDLTRSQLIRKLASFLRDNKNTVLGQVGP